MPAFVRKIDGKFRVVHKDKNDNIQIVQRGRKAVDGGGHPSAGSAQRQARAVNADKKS
jgi:hypothetical protein